MAASSLQAFSGKPTFSLPPRPGYLKVPKTVQCGGTISVIYVRRVTYRIGVHAIPDSFSCQHHKLSSIACLNLRLVKILTSQTMKHLEICLQTCKLKRCEDLRETVRNGRR